MKGTTTWSYAPYKPLMFDTGDIYIARIAPDADRFTFEWLPAGDGEYAIDLRVRGEANFTEYARTRETEYTVTGLSNNTAYEFRVRCGALTSRIRLVQTGAPVGTVVNYLHPDDSVYSFSGHSLCSPSLLKLPDGTMLASMDVFQGGAPQNLSLIFRSTDDGKTWHYLTELMPCFWGKLFYHQGAVYMLSVSTEYGDLLIGRSDDGGKTFSAPTVLLRGTAGPCAHPGIHKNPQNIVYYNGRIYETLEWGCWAKNTKHAAMVMSCDENADLLDPENWHFTPPVPYDPAWPGTAKGESSGNIEGTLVVFPDGKLYNVMRYGINNCEPSYGLVLAYRVNTDDPDAPLEYDHAIAFPGNHSKFMVKHDAVTGKYFSIVSRITSHEARGHRNLLSLLVSDDAEHWDVYCDLIDRTNEDPKYTGFQYVDFEFDGEDLMYLCRTSLNHAYNFHDANYSTFHRVKAFRNLCK